MIAVVLLAAGQGVRMNSRKQKILHEVGGRPMVLHAFLAAAEVADLPPVLVVGPDESGVRALIGDRATYAVQPEPLGTGHATLMAADALRGRADRVVVTYGDMPLLRAATMCRLVDAQRQSGAAVALLSVAGGPESTFGRVVRDASGGVGEIVEVAEARRRPNAAELLAIGELNAGVYCFDGDWLWATIPNLPIRQARRGNEYYLTDLIELAVAQGRAVVAVAADDPDEGLGAGTRAEMVEVERAFRRRVNAHWLANGVTLVEPDATWIGPDVTIGGDTVIWPNTFLQGQTTIGEACVIGPNAIVRDATVGRHCRIEQSVIEKMNVPDDTTIRPGVWRRPRGRRSGAA
ncbi:Bifunctional protein GlmU (fragment) [Candidatus Promineifilum breve]|uniref:Bifunctional protein GlmU n=1 Tax=Candidatus Promineifilum breve TaxID=1806508 RepID=A0A160T3M3_9CHLR